MPKLDVRHGIAGTRPDGWQRDRDGKTPRCGKIIWTALLDGQLVASSE